MVPYAPNDTDAFWLAVFVHLQERLRLLCPGGGCAPVNQPDACNLGKVSAHALVGTTDFKTSTAGAAAIRQLVAVGERSQLAVEHLALPG